MWDCKIIQLDELKPKELYFVNVTSLIENVSHIIKVTQFLTRCMHFLFRIFAVTYTSLLIMGVKQQFQMLKECN